MGGPNSGRWHNHIAKLTVEGCSSVLDLRLFSITMGILRPRIRQQGYFWQRYFSDYGQETMPILFKLNTLNMTRPVLELTYKIRRQITYNIPLQTVQPNYGGVRFYFSCPIRAHGVTCNSKCEKLYLPAHELIYGCRQCWNLTYTSSQTSHCGMPWQVTVQASP